MATIIKNNNEMQPSGRMKRGIAFSLDDMSHRADDYLQGVRSEAAKIIQQAKQEAEMVRRNAEKAGLAAAEEIFDRKLAEQMTTLTPALAEAVRQIDDSRHAWLGHWEKSVVKVATAIAGKIVRRELEREPQLTLQWIQEALKLAAGSGEITLRLNPIDHATLGKQAVKLAETFHPLAPTKVVADESISLGGCRIDTQYGSVDQQLETQLKRIEEELT